MQNIMTVCIGNICRSPIAEGLLKHHLQNAQPPMKISSAGLGAVVGSGADPFSVEVMEKNGYDISTHCARQLTPLMVREADLILVMQNQHKQQIEQRSPESRGKVFLLGHWSKIEIPDPVNQSYEVFEQIYVLINESVQAWKMKLLPKSVRNECAT